MQIFGIVVAIGRSEHYSVAVDYDTEFGYLDAYLWISDSMESFEIADKFSNRSDAFSDIISKLKDWTERIVSDRKSNTKEGK